MGVIKVLPIVKENDKCLVLEDVMTIEYSSNEELDEKIDDLSYEIMDLVGVLPIDSIVELRDDLSKVIDNWN